MSAVELVEESRLAQLEENSSLVADPGVVVGVGCQHGHLPLEAHLLQFGLDRVKGTRMVTSF